ncbi:hypothetical protein [Candidatus Entotheonella palauensis]|uniref:Uncharacterized protein n=1 Tax=Candidatus Entotheonella gemina TaxID=1429439 RepID=W4LQX2_9BACT|nr:hypothetical protein [Candidatus Entotheonella palauensis]ETX00368.1 MAG: hypothetical protein ETSY2_39205 [Candidatus Entotheonella gemina]
MSEQALQSRHEQVYGHRIPTTQPGLYGGPDATRLYILRYRQFLQGTGEPYRGGWM